MFQQVHVEDMVLGERDTAEQVVSLAGPTSQIQLALPMILEKVEMSGGSWGDVLWKVLEYLNTFE